MKNRVSLRLRQTLIFRMIVIASAISLFVITGFTLYWTLYPSKKAHASGNEIISSGSFIINMGVTPQTIANGLRPYGMVYDLITNYYVPVKWVIEPNKVKDAKDFTYNSIDYKGGPFVIPAEYIDVAVAGRIAYWMSTGVQGTYTTSDITLPVYTTLTSYPNLLIDNLSGNDTIVTQYFINAGIPSQAYTTGTPASLNSCHDLWVNPHGDPTWDTHSYLYNFVTVQKSYIWSECHAVSMLEGSRETVSPFRQLNYLSTNALQCWQSNGSGAASCGPTITQSHVKAASAPYSYYYPADPVMQFMGTVISPTVAGSEQWFRPQTTPGGQWRSTTKRLVTTGTGVSPAEGAIMVYGPAYGDNSNGLVMYTGGHNLNTGTTAELVAIQRSFLNFNLLAGKNKALLISAYTIPSSFFHSQTQPVSATVSTGMPPYTYQWLSSGGGSFQDPTAASTNYTAPPSPASGNIIIRCIVTDACGRRNFIAQRISIGPNPLPVSLTNFDAKVNAQNMVDLKWSTSSEIDNDYFTIERSNDGINFTGLSRIDGAGTSSERHDYSFTDKKPFSGLSYYRLRQTDHDGRNEVFRTVAVNVKNKLSNNSVSITPNPFSDSFTVTFESESNEQVTLSLVTMNGITLFSEKFEVTAGKNYLKCNVISMGTKGMCLLSIANNKKILATTRAIYKGN